LIVARHRLLANVAHVLDMSDPEHPAFADSAADCLDELLRHEAAIRALLADFALGSDIPVLALAQS